MITYYFFQDGLGSTSQLANSSGNWVESYSYDLHGRPSANSTVGNRFLFTGREWYAELGLYNYRNRFYHPDLGRFLQPDPIGFGGDPTNLYRYCGNNPVNGRDPSGLEWIYINEKGGTNEVVVNGNDDPFGLGNPIGTDFGTRSFTDLAAAFLYLETSPFGIGGGTSPGGGGLGPGHNSIGKPLPPSPPLPPNIPPSPLPQNPFKMNVSLTLGSTPLQAVTPYSNTFQQFTINIGPVGGISVSFALSPTGQTFISIGPQLGKSPEFVSASVTANYMFGMRYSTSQQVSQALSGWSTSVGGGFIGGGQATWNSWQWTPSSVGGGVYLPQFGISAGYTFEGPTISSPYGY